MPKDVPYQPWAAERPIAGSGAAGFTPRVPEAAFGVTVNQAISHLGRTIEGAGDEMFRRAEALKALDNETAAKEADARYMIETGEAHARYSAMSGKDAV